MRIHSRIPDQIHPAPNMDTYESLIAQIHSKEINMELIEKSHDHSDFCEDLLKSNFSPGSCSSLLTFNQNLYCCPSFLFSLHSYHSFQEDLH